MWRLRARGWVRTHSSLGGWAGCPQAALTLTRGPHCSPFLDRRPVPTGARGRRTGLAALRWRLSPAVFCSQPPPPPTPSGPSASGEAYAQREGLRGLALLSYPRLLCQGVLRNIWNPQGWSRGCPSPRAGRPVTLCFQATSSGCTLWAASGTRGTLPATCPRWPSCPRPRTCPSRPSPWSSGTPSAPSVSPAPVARTLLLPRGPSGFFCSCEW